MCGIALIIYSRKHLGGGNERTFFAVIAVKNDNERQGANKSKGGNEAYSVMAGTLRELYGSDVLIAAGNSFTGSVLKADYTEKMAG